MVKELNRNARVIPFLIASSISYFLSNANLLQRFEPRSVCMYRNMKLMALHGVSDTAVFISFSAISFILFSLYKHLAAKGLPFTQLFWEFAAFIFLCGVAHLLNALDLYVTFYWLDGAVKLVTAWFSILVMLALIRDFKKIKDIKTPKEFEELNNKLNEVLKRLDEK